MWHAILLASILCLGWKVAGYYVPQRWFAPARPRRILELSTVALLSALVSVQTFASGAEITLDARIPAVLLAAALFALRVPFIVVIVAAAVTAALLRRYLGMA